MPLLRLAYSTQFLLAVIAVYTMWSQVGGQGHLDLMPWYLKLGLGGGAAFAFVKATAAAVARDHPWHGRTLRWSGILLALLLGCGLATYYYHTYEEDTGDEEEQGVTSFTNAPRMMKRYEASGLRSARYVGSRAIVRRVRGA